MLQHAMCNPLFRSDLVRAIERSIASNAPFERAAKYVEEGTVNCFDHNIIQFRNQATPEPKSAGR